MTSKRIAHFAERYLRDRVNYWTSYIDSGHAAANGEDHYLEAVDVLEDYMDELFDLWDTFGKHTEGRTGNYGKSNAGNGERI